MPDFKVQRGSTTLTTAQAANTTSVTAVAALVNAALFSSSNRYIGGSTTANTGDVLQNDEYASSLRLSAVDTVTVERQINNGPTHDLYHEWELLEYIGAAGGAHEIKTRQRSFINFSGSSLTADGTDITNIVAAAKVVIKPCGVNTRYQFGQAERLTCTFKLVASGANWKVRATRNNNDTLQATDEFHYEVIELTGSNWGRQVVDHAFASVGVETETITSATVSKSLVLLNYRTSEADSESISCLCYQTNATTLAFELDSKCVTPTVCDAVAYLITNAALTITHYNGDIPVGTDLTTPLNISITAVDSLSRTLTLPQCIVHKDSVGSQTRPPTDCFTGALTSTTNYRLKRSRDAVSRGKYRLSVIEFPAGGTTSTITTIADALIAKQFLRTVSADALVQATKTINTSADALLQKTRAISVVADAILARLNTLQFDADALLSKQIIKTLLADALLETPGRITFSADAIIDRIGQVTFAADAQISKQIVRQCVADALLVLRRERTVNADALLQKQVTVNMQADAIISGRWLEVIPPNHIWTAI